MSQDNFINVEFVNNAGGSTRTNDDILEGTSLLNYLNTKLGSTDGKVVKVNNEAVDGSDWESYTLSDGDQVRVMAANIKGA